MFKRIFSTYTAAILVVLSVAALSFAQTSPKSFPQVTIENFGQMDEHFYRGAQPTREEFQELKDLGIKTVIDLRGDATDYEKPAVEALGMKYVNLPMSGLGYPKAEYIDAFLKLANDPETGSFYVHCKGGVHRTGVAGAAYRFTKYGWNYDQVYQEMLNYRFSTSGFHGKFKTFVEDYSNKMIASRAQGASTQNTIQPIQKQD